MPRRILLDTGVLVALVNRADPDHSRCVEAFASLKARLVTVEGVLVESSYLLRGVRGGPQGAIGLVLSTGAELWPASAEVLRRAVDLITIYSQRRMDLVDALLVAASEALAIDEVLTLDRRDFSTYRRSNGRRFHILPDG